MNNQPIPNLPPNPEATEFVQQELADARAGLRRAKTFAAISIGITAGYLGFITHVLATRLLAPEAAAQFATDNVRVWLHTHGQEWSQQLVEQIPAWIAQAPDELLARLPRMRCELEQRVVAQVTCQARALAPMLLSSLDEFLAENEQVIREFLNQAGDEETVRLLGDELEQRFWAALQTPGSDGQSAADRLRSGVAALQLTRQQVHRLAYAADLSPEERQLRRVIGLVLQYAHQT
ncbi:MAG: hypothetical protein N3A53_00200 [Verrucomicrobiae bacterium]|nr:hypothetical protein [Verrucomicrobiae bacterium]